MRTGVERRLASLERNRPPRPDRASAIRDAALSRLTDDELILLRAMAMRGTYVANSPEEAAAVQRFERVLEEVRRESAGRGSKGEMSPT